MKVHESALKHGIAAGDRAGPVAEVVDDRIPQRRHCLPAVACSLARHIPFSRRLALSRYALASFSSASVSWRFAARSGFCSSVGFATGLSHLVVGGRVDIHVMADPYTKNSRSDIAVTSCLRVRERTLARSRATTSLTRRVATRPPSWGSGSSAARRIPPGSPARPCSPTGAGAAQAITVPPACGVTSRRFRTKSVDTSDQTRGAVSLPGLSALLGILRG